MTRSLIRPTPRAASSPRLASIWLALAVALLSSLMPIGLPRTVSVGSAFNPATTAVVLQPSRALPRVMTEVAKPQDDLTGSPPQVATLPVALPRSIARAVAPVAAPPPAGLRPRLARSTGLSGNPRGPPLP